MMASLTAALLGLLEGVTEFLPISSTGHLILINRWLTFGEPFTKLFDVVIQSGAILAVVVLFWKDIWPKAWTFESLKKQWGSVFVAFVPTVLIAGLFGSWVQEQLFFPIVVAVALIFYGVIFIVVERHHIRTTYYVPRTTLSESNGPSYFHAFIVGAAQTLALVPGTSRSGVTILALLLLGYSRPAAAKFSFLLAIPTLFAASVYSLYKYRNPIANDQYFLLLVGFVVSFFVAYAVSKWLMRYIRSNSFEAFGWYRIALGALVLLSMAIFV